MSKSAEIPIANKSRDYDNPFIEAAFSPPQANQLQRVNLPAKPSTYNELRGDRERSASQPLDYVGPPKHKISGEEFRRQVLDEKVASNPNLGGGDRPNQTVDEPRSSLVLKEFKAATKQGVASPIAGRPFHSAPVTPCETPLGSRQGSPKTGRRSVGLLSAIFGAGIFRRQSELGYHLDHLVEDNEEDFSSPLGSPGNVFFEELRTKLDVMDDVDGARRPSGATDDQTDFYLSDDAVLFLEKSPSPTGLIKTPTNQKMLDVSAGGRGVANSELGMNFREFTLLTPTSM